MNRRKFLINQKLGVYTILSFCSTREMKTRNGRIRHEFLYSVKCSKCEHIKTVTETNLKYCLNDPPFYCMNCPKELKALGRKLRRLRTEERRKTRGQLNTIEAQLFRLAIFKQLA